MHINRSWVSMVAVVALVSAVRGWDCVCNPTECEPLEPSGCPGLGIVVWDPCRCCKVCARTVGEDCGGFRGTCEPGLKCYEADFKKMESIRLSSLSAPILLILLLILI